LLGEILPAASLEERWEFGMLSRGSRLKYANARTFYSQIIWRPLSEKLVSPGIQFRY
jgi:hypothetical protein